MTERKRDGLGGEGGGLVGFGLGLDVAGVDVPCDDGGDEEEEDDDEKEAQAAAALWRWLVGQGWLGGAPA